MTNLCPNAGNAKWCPNVGQQNDYKFGYHFDIMLKEFGHLLDGTPWNNPVVWFEQITCKPELAAHKSDCGKN